MKPGERVLTIQAIAVALWPQDRATVNLICRQFGLAEPDFLGSHDSAEEYEELIRFVEAIPDETLLDMADTLAPDRSRRDAGEAPAVASSPERGPWTTGFFRIFVSHTYKHHERVGWLKTRLETRGVDALSRTRTSRQALNGAMRFERPSGRARRWWSISLLTSGRANGPTRRLVTASHRASRS